MSARAAALIALVLVPTIAPAVEVSRARYLMGTVCEIALDGDPRQAEAAFDEAARIERFLSTWREDSELSRVNRGDAGALSPELRSLLDRVIAWRDRSGGAFEPQIRPLVDAWRTRESGAVPSPQAIANAVAQIRSGRAAFEEGGFGKGYALDRMMAAIGGRDVVINFGGQLAVRGPHTVSIAHPLHRDQPVVTLTLRDASLSTSSGSEKTFEIGGRRFTHIIDPHTGEALPPRGSVSVIAPSAFDADVLSTALYVMGPERGLAWARAHDVTAIFIGETGEVTKSKEP